MTENTSVLEMTENTSVLEITKMINYKKKQKYESSSSGCHRIGGHQNVGGSR